MKNICGLFHKGYATPLALGAAAILGFFAVIGASSISSEKDPVVDMRIKPVERVVSVNEIFEIEVIVESSLPVNVFAGELHFNHAVLEVQAIDYNTSIANVWVELPWYSNGDGTLNFTGGTNAKGGFSGADRLIKVTLRAKRVGEGIISIHEPRILLHDNLGTDAELVGPLDAIFTVENNSGNTNNLLTKTSYGTYYKIGTDAPSTDLNNDGKQSLADISIFMLNIAGNDTRFDFNIDGKVNTKDLNILLSTE